MFSPRSSRRDRVTAAAVSSARWRCCTSVRDTGKGNPRRARCTEAALKIIAASLVCFFFILFVVTSWSWSSSLKRKTNSTWCLRSSGEVREQQLQQQQDVWIQFPCLFTSTPCNASLQPLECSWCFVPVW